MLSSYESDIPEAHLFILWNNGQVLRDKIISSISSHFCIEHIIDVEWDAKLFDQNLRRFYGQNLPKNSNKCKECGIGPFTAIIVCDMHPVYAPRRTTSGVHVVNINMFDEKEKIRKFAGSNILHSTNTVQEAEHDITLLFGMSSKDLLSHNFSNTVIKKNIVGSHGWTDIKTMLYVLNHTCKYVILRNFENYPESIKYGEHSDIDILCDNYEIVKLILNSKNSTSQPGRVQQIVAIGDNYVNVDLRYVGDGYYDSKWEKDILSKRVYDDRGFYVPDTESYLFTLMYHALIQKNKIANDYASRITDLCKDIGLTEINLCDEDSSLSILKNYMHDYSYQFVEPKDYTVGFNYRKINARAGLYRTVRKCMSDCKHLLLQIVQSR